MTDLVRRLVNGSWDWVLVEPGGGGDLPDWWTVDSTPGSEFIQMAGALGVVASPGVNENPRLYLEDLLGNEAFSVNAQGTVAIAPGADAAALVINTHPGVGQETLPFQFYDQDGLLAVDIDSQGILDVRRVTVQDPPDTAASGEGNTLLLPSGVLISMGPNPAPGRPPLRVDKWEPGAGTYRTVLAVGQNFTDGMLQLQPGLNEPVVEITSPEDDVGEAIRLWDHQFNAERFVLDYTGAVTINRSTKGLGLKITAADGSEEEGTELFEIMGDEGHRLLGFDAWGALVTDLYEHPPYDATAAVFSHSASTPEVTAVIAEFSTGKEGVPPVDAGHGGAMLRAVSVAQPVRIQDEDFVDVIRVEHTGSLRVTLPTANPGPGLLWNDGNTVKVGT